MSSELIKEEKLVFIQNDDVFTNSKLISDGAGVGHSKLKKAIKKYADRLKKFGKLSAPHGTESFTGGRRVEVYDLNEPQAMFLITLLKNTEKVLDFKEKLVQQFYLMREELRKLQTARPIYLEARRTLTDSIKSLPESEHKKWKYKQYTDLIYKLVIGKTATQKRKELGLGKNQKITSFLNSEQLNEMAKLEQQATMLIEMGFEYEQIKNGLTNLYEKIKSFKPQIEQYKMIGV